MKNLYRNMMLVAAAAMSFTSCSEDATEDVVNPEVPMMELAIDAQIDDTRVTLNGDRTRFQWTAWADEKLGIFTDVDSKQYESNSYKDASTALEVTVPANATKVYAYYPLYSSNSDKTKVSLYVANSQYQAQPGVLQGTNAIDNKGLNSKGKASSGQFPMIAAGEIKDGAVSLSFRPVACALALNIYDTDPNRPDEKVSSVKFTPNGGVKNYGTQHVDLTTEGDTFVYTGAYSGDITVTLGTPAEIATTKPNAQTNPKQVYICTARVNYTQGGTITVYTDKKNEYSFNIPAFSCENCDLLPISLDLKKKRPALADLAEGDYIIVASNTTATEFYALTNKETSSSTVRMTSKDDFEDVRSMTSYTTDDNTLLWHIAKSGKNYVISDVNEQYLSWTSSNSASLSENAYPLEIWETAGVYQIKSVQDNTRILARNNTISNKYFAFYNSDNQYDNLYLVPAEIGVVERCTITEFTAEWNAAKTEVALSGAYTSTYATEPDWSLTVSKDGGAATSLDVFDVEGKIVADNYTVTEDGTYVFTLTATVNGSVVATKTAEVTKYPAGAGAVSYVFSEHFNYSDYTSIADQTIELDSNISLVFAIGGASNNPQIKNAEVRMYANKNTHKGNTLTITAANGRTITNVIFAFADNKNYLTASTGSLSTDKTTWTGSSSSIVFTCNGTTSDQRAYINTITVTYE